MDSFFRWFYDASKNMDRVDGLGMWQSELVFTERIFDHAKKQEINVFYQTETVSCYIGPLNHTLPKPNFDRAKYIGKSIHDYTPCYHWLEEDPEQRFSLQYFDTQDTRKPVRMDFSDNERHRAMTFIFHEFDSCPQDKNLFTIPAEIQAQCNSF